MVRNDRNLEKEWQPGIPDRFSDNVKALFEPPGSVPPEVDRAILDRIHEHFVHQVAAQGGRRRFRWAGLWRVAAAAAVVILAFSIELTRKSGPATDRTALMKPQAVDIDRNGRVDILDAFKLARQIESAGPTEQNWDVNGDGLVDSDDVDVVAFAAVRLDKGVL